MSVLPGYFYLTMWNPFILNHTRMFSRQNRYRVVIGILFIEPFVGSREKRWETGLHLLENWIFPRIEQQSCSLTLDNKSIRTGVNIVLVCNIVMACWQICSLQKQKQSVSRMMTFSYPRKETTENALNIRINKSNRID